MKPERPSAGPGVADRELDIALGQPPFELRPPSVAESRDLDFSRAVLEDLYRYPKKKRSVAIAFWALSGLMGGHRFYLDRTGTGVAMLFSIGGAGLWWFADLFFIKRMVRTFNEDQAHRQATGLPPRSLSFMPPLLGATLPTEPAWVAKRRGPRRLVGDLIVVFTAGISMGAFAASNGNPEPILAVLALIAITILGARWDALATLPLLRGFDRWNHRLRLYYHVNDPGSALQLVFRPLGILVAPFRRRVRAEARLYLQLGAWFTILFTAIDVIQAAGIGTPGGINPGVFFADLGQTFFSVYAFTAPIGAVLTKHVLMEKRDAILWVLCGVTIFAIASGLFGAFF